jgi:opacity protein-like surface antigen
MRIRSIVLAVAACAAMALSTTAAAAVPALASSGGGPVLTGTGYSPYSNAYVFRVTSHTDHTVFAGIYGTNYGQDLPGIALGVVTIPPRATVTIPVGTTTVRVWVCTDSRIGESYCHWVTETRPDFLPYNWLTLKAQSGRSAVLLVIHVTAT